MEMWKELIIVVIATFAGLGIVLWTGSSRFKCNSSKQKETHQKGGQRPTESIEEKEHENKTVSIKLDSKRIDQK